MIGLQSQTLVFKKAVWIFAFIFILCTMTVAGIIPKSSDKVIEININSLQMRFDKNTGSLIRLSSKEGCVFLETTPDRAGIVDFAYPIKEFEPLRMASRFSQNVRIEKQNGGVLLHWENLGASRTFPLTGHISVTVQIKPAPDGRSVILTCEITNDSGNSIRQVLFPDFVGLIPFAGEQNTRFRLAPFVIEPFEMLKPDPLIVPFYGFGKFGSGDGWMEFKSGKYRSFSQKLVDWLDFGDVKNGFSIYARRWPSEDPNVSMMLHLSEIDHKLRLLFAHNIEIAPGEKWQSDDYWLTPHQHGWAEGIQPFRKWVQQNLHRRFELPKHIKNGMGFRTVWMSKGRPEDREHDVLYSYKDLPEIAKESIDHGLNELVPWFWGPGCQLPFTTVNTLGSRQELLDAVAECRKLGVNVSLFISVLYLGNPSATKYGLTPSREMAWTYHPELIPKFNPHYAAWNELVLANQNDVRWQADVLTAFKEFFDIGITSFVWDVFWAAPVSPNLYDLSEKIRIAAKKSDIQSVYAGEGGCDMRRDYEYLDYMWNWNWNWDWPHNKDFRPLASVFPAPRFNVNIDKSVQMVKYCFADNTYMNIMPAQPDGVNASDLIANHPPLSRALRQCAKLRQQFLAYFTDGRMIGDSILEEESPGAHISAFVLPDKILTILVKDENEGKVPLTCDPRYWLDAGIGRIKLKIYNSDGLLVGTEQFTDKIWQKTTPVLLPHEILLYEFSA
jgi:hypothetical protein